MDSQDDCAPFSSIVISSLCLLHCKMPKKTFEGLLRCCSSLRELELTGFRESFPGMIQSIAELVPQIEKLVFQNNMGLVLAESNTEHVKYLKRLSSLKHLDIYTDYFECITPFSELFANHQLEVVCIRGGTIDDHFVRSAAMSSVKHISFDFIHDIKAHHLLTLANNWNELQYLRARSRETGFRLTSMEILEIILIAPKLHTFIIDMEHEFELDLQLANVIKKRQVMLRVSCKSGEGFAEYLFGADPIKIKSSLSSCGNKTYKI